MSEHVFDVLKARGYLAQVTHEEDVRDYLGKEGGVFYVGFDPTANSLHIGHFIQMMVMTHLQRAGHVPIALMGGGTGHIGDPSGRTDMRSMMTRQTIEDNVNHFIPQMERLLDFSEGRAILANNADWLLELNYIDFIREIGRHFSVNRMLTAECYKQRLEKGLTFLEFNYMLLQAYDFLVLYRKHGCRLQLGGDDQWSNILAGVDLIRRVEQGEAYGMTFALLTNSAGEKMGKTAKGAVWLDADRFPVYDFFQYLRNVDDADVIRFMKLLTFMPLEEIADYEKLSGSAVNEAKEKLALEVTALVHGREAAEEAAAAARSLFGSGAPVGDAVPTVEIRRDELDQPLIQLLADHKLTASRSEARRLLRQGGLYVHDEAVNDLDFALSEDDLDDDGSVIIRLGKKRYHRLHVNEP